MLSLDMQKGNSPLIIVSVVIVVAIAAGVFILSRNNSPITSTLPTISSDSMDKKQDNAMMKENSRYVEYSKDGYEVIRNTRHVLFFYANWCPTCRPADAEFQAQMSQIPENTTLVRVNYNDTETDADEEALANEYGITYQHTYVFLENGQEVSRWNGGGLAELVSQVR